MAKSIRLMSPPQVEVQRLWRQRTAVGIAVDALLERGVMLQAYLAASWSALSDLRARAQGLPPI